MLKILFSTQVHKIIINRIDRNTADGHRIRKSVPIDERRVKNEKLFDLDFGLVVIEN